MFLLGAPKCGTTSLADWMGKHSRIVQASNKEPGFFRGGGRRWVRDGHHPDTYREQDPNSPMCDPKAYMSIFAGAGPDDWLLDASTDYFSDVEATERLKDLARHNTVRLICLLRDPVQRAFSEYSHTIRDNLEPLSFRASLEAEQERIDAGFQPLFFHIQRSLYFEHISRYRAAFGDALMLFDISDLRDIAALNHKISQFLDILIEELGEIRTLNASGADGIRERVGRKGLLVRQTKDVIRGIVGRKATAEMTEKDRAYVRELLQKDMQSCLSDPDIPTDSWNE